MCPAPAALPDRRRRELIQTLRALQALDLALLVITHDLPFALELCDESVSLDKGQLVASGETRNILSNAELLARHRLEMPFGFRLDQAST